MQEIVDTKSNYFFVLRYNKFILTVLPDFAIIGILRKGRMIVWKLPRI